MKTKIDKTKAQLLANLILIAIHKNYKYFDILYSEKSEKERSLEEDVLFAEKLECNSKKDFDPTAPNHDSSVSLKVIKWLWHTDRPIFSLRNPLNSFDLRTLPFGFIAVNEKDKELYVALRGTMTSEEWRNNFAFKMTENCPNSNILGLVHRGFHSIFTFGYQDTLRKPSNTLIRAKHFLTRKKNSLVHQKTISISDSIFEAIVNNNWHKRGYRIFITGYSLGGALAMLAGQMLLSRDAKYVEILSICTFGAPRTGNEGFAAWFQSLDVVRYVNSEDIVPTMPPPTGKLFGSDIADNSSEIMIAERVSAYRGINNQFRANKGFIQYSKNKEIKSIEEAFIHIGEPRVFTQNRGSISYNHNLFKTYREGIDLIET